MVSKLWNYVVVFFRKVGIILPLTTVLLALKLTGLLPMSWWIIAAPLVLYLIFLVWLFVAIFVNTVFRSFMDIYNSEDKKK